MNKLTAFFASAILATGLSSCSDEPTPAEPAASSSMDDMAMAAESRHATGTGTITAIDAATGRVTIDHGEVSELEWPAMEMGFESEPATIEGFSVGDRVDFEFDWDGSKGALSKIVRAQP